MPETTSVFDTPMLGAEISTAFVRQTASWMEGQRELLASAGAIMTDWLNRQREAIDLSSRSLQRVWQSRNLADLLQAHQQWTSDCLRWTAATLHTVRRDVDTVTQTAQAQSEASRETFETLRREAGRRRGTAEADPATTAAE